MRRTLHRIGAAALGLVLVAAAGTPAQASPARAASASLSFSGSGASMRMITSVKFTATYTGAYNVKYDVFRSLTSARTNPVKVNTRTVFTRTFAALSGTTYVYRPYSTPCPAGSTTYYYWVRASITDTSSGTVVVRSPSVAAAACTSV